MGKGKWQEDLEENENDNEKGYKQQQIQKGHCEGYTERCGRPDIDE